jgi:hypothetical protein
LLTAEWVDILLVDELSHININSLFWANNINIFLKLILVNFLKCSSFVLINGLFIQEVASFIIYYNVIINTWGYYGSLYIIIVTLDFFKSFNCHRFRLTCEISEIKVYIRFISEAHVESIWQSYQTLLICTLNFGW